MLNVKITGSGYYLPSKIETVEEIATKINKSVDKNGVDLTKEINFTFLDHPIFLHN